MEGIVEIEERDTGAGDVLFSYENQNQSFFIVISGKLCGSWDNNKREKFKVDEILGRISFLGKRGPAGIVRITQRVKLLKFSWKRYSIQK